MGSYVGNWFKKIRNTAILRTTRRYVLLRALRRRGRMRSVVNRTKDILPNHILLFCTERNEYARLPYFLDYYRKLGVDHFLFVDNGSDDGSVPYLESQPDVSLWHTTADYRGARFGMDWMNALLFKYGTGHWCLTVDPDEFLVYPHCDTRPLSALTGWLDASAHKSFSAMLIDFYPKGPIENYRYRPGDNPFEIARWFDPANYTIKKNGRMGNLWIQGGPRMRVFFADNPIKAPALNKIPLIRWERHYCYISSTHMALPRSLNLVYDELGGEKASGALLHTKFLPSFIDKAAEELDRKQHYANSAEYEAYHQNLHAGVNIWCEESVEYQDWQQLEDIGLISKGNWA